MTSAGEVIANIGIVMEAGSDGAQTRAPAEALIEPVPSSRGAALAAAETR
jgi:hypothetical protein